MGRQATAGVPDDEEYDEAESQRIGHTIGQPSVNAGMSRNLMHTNSIASQPNLPVGCRLATVRQITSTATRGGCAVGQNHATMIARLGLLPGPVTDPV